MRVNEIFTSIQGEGVHAGKVMTFIRLSGCNLRCTWCDTKYAQGIGEGDEIISSKIKAPAKWVCITGGEPLVQADEVAALALELHLRGRYIEIETNGSISPPSWAFVDVNGYPLIDSWVVDIKLPSTGNESSREIIVRWIKRMRPSDQIKMVVSNEEDLKMAEYWLNMIWSGVAEVLISPVMNGSTTPDGLGMQKVADFCIRKNLRLSLQLHKIIWGNKRGV